jgi:uncharacterized protein (TIGR00106 family)
MSTLVAVSISPVGVGEELGAEVAKVIKVIRDSGLPNHTSSMSTEIEGEWGEVMKVVGDAVAVFTDRGIRTSLSLKADIRPGVDGRMTAKVETVERILGERS